jgi:hypothetical protein
MTYDHRPCRASNISVASHRDYLARRFAEEIADVLNVEISDAASYTYAKTWQAAAWPLVGNVYDARLAVNVEDDDRPYGVVETGSLDDPQFHMILIRFIGTWVEGSLQGPNLCDALGADHPILHVR